jgi:cation transport protein ChaC
VRRSLAHTLRGWDEASDLWLFGYGSLMWNPAFDFVEQCPATLHGYHRRFCLWMHMGRGTPERPGMMLALDRGGMCRGLAFRIAAREVREELLLVWRREMLGSAYIPRWIPLSTDTGRVRAVTFVVNRRHVRYSGRVCDDEAAAAIGAASGALGSCLEYLTRTAQTLAEHGQDDFYLARLLTRIAARQAIATAA